MGRHSLPFGIDLHIPLPEWTVYHLPHDSTHIPPAAELAALGDAWAVSRLELAAEIERMTDHHTLAAFTQGFEPPIPPERIVAAPVSRLVVDTERFRDDAHEPMAALGLGAVYQNTSQGAPLRQPLHPHTREALLQRYYDPHHQRLTQAVDAMLARHGQCIVLDCHSFPLEPLPFETPEAAACRPQICLGTDAFHTPDALVQRVRRHFEKYGLQIELNLPFSGALTPLKHYRKDPRVSAIMIEVRRDLLISRRSTGQPKTPANTPIRTYKS
jgi:N-formylglutamate amidohydrolase